MTTIAENLEQLAYDLGGTALERGVHFVTLLAALIAFFCSVVSCLYILAPTKSLHFVLLGGMLIGRSGDWHELPRTYVRLAGWIDALFARNESTLARMFFFYRFAATSIVVSVILWSVEIAA